MDLYKHLIYSMVVCSSMGYGENSNAPVTEEIRSAETINFLLKSLEIIGASSQDIDVFRDVGQVSPTLIRTFSYYTSNASQAKFSQLTEEERAALIRFAFILKNKQQINRQQISKLLISEKLRIGMSPQEVKNLDDLKKKLTENPLKSLTESDLTTIKQVAPYLDADPFPFADFIGVAIKAKLISNAPDLTEALKKGAEMLTGITQEQIQRVNPLFKDYSQATTLELTTDNIATINLFIESAIYPFGSYLLISLIGYDNVLILGDILQANPQIFHSNYSLAYESTVSSKKH